MSTTVRRTADLYWPMYPEQKCEYLVPCFIYSFKNCVLSFLCRLLLCILSSRSCRMDDMVIKEASRHGLSITEVAGTRAVIRNLGGVIYEITSA